MSDFPDVPIVPFEYINASLLPNITGLIIMSTFSSQGEITQNRPLLSLLYLYLSHSLHSTLYELFQITGLVASR